MQIHDAGLFHFTKKQEIGGHDIMKKIGALISLVLLLVILSTSFALAAPFSVDATSPKDGETGMAMDNMGVKVEFTQGVYSEKYQADNIKQFKLVDDKGKQVPIRVVFNPKDTHIVLVLADTANGAVIKGSTQYTLTIGADLVAADGTLLGKEDKITFETLNPATSMTSSMVMMGVMVVGMVYFSSRTAKKEAEKSKVKKDEVVNPYKVAKETGKTVEEIVAIEQKKKEKQTQKEAKKQRHVAENKVEIISNNMRVSKARPISAGGGKYKTGKAAIAAKKAAAEKARQERKQQQGAKKGKKKNK
jgi:hypothetical protein